MQLEDVVRETVEEFVRDGVLFTALDVSNKVKVFLPFARHREVRELVRAAFVTNIEPQGYARTPVNVVLTDGCTTEALLYHPLSDAWDLDAKYDVQKRSQVTNKSVNVAKTVQTTVVKQVAVPVYQVPVPVVLPARAVWDQLFNSQPSLFPRK